MTQWTRFIVSRFYLKISLIIKKKKTNVKTPHFYITPKVHKKNVPGRSVVSSIDCLDFPNLLITTSSPTQKLYHPTLSTPQISETNLLQIHQKTLSQLLWMLKHFILTPRTMRVWKLRKKHSIIKPRNPQQHN